MHTLFLLNPTAGKTDCTQQLPQQINATAARAGLAPEEYTIRITTHAGHARELARAAAAGAQQAGEPLRIFTAGGDGTFNEALTGAYGFAGTAVGCLPYGSGNDFLRTFGTREEFLDLDAQLAGGAVPIDLMQTNLGLSATICAAGLDAQVAYGIPKFRRIPLCGGEGSYLLSIVEQLCGHIGRRVEYTIDGETFAVDCLMCAICNGRTYGGGFCAGPEAQPDDGWLDVFIVRKVGRLTIAKLLSMYKNGRHFQNGQLVEAAKPYFIYRRAKAVTLPMDAGPSLPQRTANVPPASRCAWRCSRCPDGSGCQRLLTTDSWSRKPPQVLNDRKNESFAGKAELFLFALSGLIFSLSQNVNKKHSKKS